MRIYIIRHAAPDYENDTLTEQGHREAKVLAQRLAAHGLDKIYTSPLGRAIETAKYTAAALNLDLNIEEWTRELWPDLVMKDSPWGSVMAINIPGEVLRAKERRISRRTWHKYSYLYKIKTLATFKKLQANSDAFFLRHGYQRVGGRYRCLSPNHEQIAVFCHGGFALTWLAHLLEIPPPLVWAGFWLPTSSVTTVLFDQRSPEWAVPRCLGVADVSHLYAAGLPVNPQGFKGNYY